MTIFTIVTTLYLFPVIVLTEILYKENFRSIMTTVSGAFFWLVLFGYVQLILYKAGIIISFENLNEMAPENVSTLLGANILRPNSLFGEPRNLAAFLFPIFFMIKMFNVDNHSTNILFIIFFCIGILTSSITFLLFIVFFSFYYLFLVKGTLASAYVKILILLVFTTLGFTSIAFIYQLFPRILPYVETFTVVGGSTIFGAELRDQAVDFFLVTYLFDIAKMDIGILNTIFGNGLGSYSYIIDKYYLEYFNFSPLQNDLIYGSRILLFTILVENGLFGLFILFGLQYELYKKVKTLNEEMGINRQILKHFTVSLFIGSNLSASYFFILSIIIICALIIYQRSEILLKKVDFDF